MALAYQNPYTSLSKSSQTNLNSGQTKAANNLPGTINNPIKIGAYSNPEFPGTANNPLPMPKATGVVKPAVQAPKVTAPATPKGLNSQQTASLNALSARIAGGYNPNATDTANLNFGKSQGYNYTAPTPTTPATPATTTPTSGIQGYDARLAAEQAQRTAAAEEEKKYTPTEYTQNTSPAQDKLNSIYDLMLANLTPSAQEKATAEQLNQTNQAMREGLLNTEQQVIPMEFITGQQNAISKMGTNKAQTLQEQLSTMQSQRNASMSGLAQAGQLAGNQQENYQNDINFNNTIAQSGYKPYEKGIMLKPGEKLVSLTNPVSGQTRQYVQPTAGFKEIAAGTSLYDPTTGKMVSQAPANTAMTDYQKGQLSESEKDRASRESISQNQLAMDREKLYNASTNKTLTEAQRKANGYASRMAEANALIANYESLGSEKKGLITQFLPNMLKSDERQAMEQAQRNFINATLRQESGAAIAETEFESAKKQYFPQPGDSQLVIDQKRANRQTTINGMMGEAGAGASSDDNFSW